MLTVEIFSGGTLIGIADLYASDPPMGVAAGKLVPTAAYHGIKPVIDQLNKATSPDWDKLALKAVTQGGREIFAAGGIWIADLLDINDWQPEVNVLGIGSEQGEYDAWFGADPAYLSYYGKNP
jgi:hypothetical protein